MKKIKTTTKHLFSTLIIFLAIALALLLLVYTVTLPHAATKSKGEFVLFVTMQDGPLKATLFGGSFPDNQSCIEYAKKQYPLDNRRWIEYTCIHEDVHAYLEEMKGKGLNI